MFELYYKTKLSIFSMFPVEKFDVKFDVTIFDVTIFDVPTTMLPFSMVNVPVFDVTVFPLDFSSQLLLSTFLIILILILLLYYLLGYPRNNSVKQWFVTVFAWGNPKAWVWSSWTPYWPKNLYHIGYTYFRTLFCDFHVPFRPPPWTPSPVKNLCIRGPIHNWLVRTV